MYEELKIEVQAKDDEIKSMKKEVAVVEELKSVVKVLREDLTNTR